MRKHWGSLFLLFDSNYWVSWECGFLCCISLSTHKLGKLLAFYSAFIQYVKERLHLRDVDSIRGFIDVLIPLNAGANIQYLESAFLLSVTFLSFLDDKLQ